MCLQSSSSSNQTPPVTCWGGYTRLENISRYRGGIGRVLVFAWTVQSQHSIVCWSTITCPTCSCCWLGVVNSFANVAIQFYSWGEKKVLDTWNFLIGNLDKRMWLFPVWGTAEREKKKWDRLARSTRQPGARKKSWARRSRGSSKYGGVDNW